MNKSISEQYNFEDFTLDHYRHLITETKKNYTFSSYSDFDKNARIVLWRHDVDFSPQRALKLAQIEHELDVQATYFWHLHSEYYNLLEKETCLIVKQILDLGHHIGIHFDTHFYDITNENELEQFLTFEKNILDSIFKTDIKVFSFHVIDPLILTFDRWSYANMINTYATYFKENLTYCSDSNGYWKFSRMFDVVEKAEARSLHLLTHPEWWVDDVMSPWQRINRAFEGRKQKSIKTYTELLKKYSAKNIDWEGEI